MQFEENVPLRTYSNLRVGGPAKYFKIVNSKNDLIEALQLADKMKLRVFVVGGGTNILWSDEGYNGLVLKPEINFIQEEGDNIVAGASVPMGDLVDLTTKSGLTGLDWAGGLPGTFGGAIFGNAGCFGGEIKDSVVGVESISLDGGEVRKRNNEECKFGYRDSIFKSGGIDEIIVQATLQLSKGEKNVLAEKIASQKQYREDHQPLDKPNIGSFFKNVRVEGLSEELVAPHRSAIKTDPFPVIPAAHLINEAGLRGVVVGEAMVSPKHPNFLVNLGSATTNDFLSLIAKIKKDVREKTGIELEEEVRVIK